MTVSAPRYNVPYATAFDTTGIVCPEALLNFYISGSSTPANTYSDPGLTTPNSNPVQANGAGLFPSIFLQAISYKVVLTTADGDEIWTADPVSGSTNGLANIATLAELRAAPVTAGEVIYLEGTSAPGDGIQGIFYFNALSLAADDNGQTTVQPTGVVTGRWIRIPLGWPYGGMTNTGGALYKGSIGSSTVNGATVFRTDAQLAVENGASGHSLFSIGNNLPTTEEGAISWDSYYSNASITQQAATFVRWVNGDNDAVTGVNVWGTHVIGAAAADNTPLMLFGDNSVVLGAGGTSGIPWNASRVANWTDNRNAGFIARTNCFVIATGQSHSPTDPGAQTLDVTGSFRVGAVDGSFNSSNGFEAGYSSGGGTAYAQGFNRSGAVFIPLTVGGLTTSIQANGSNAISISNTSSSGIKFNGYGAGTLTTDASGNITATSDLTVKTDIEPFGAGLLNVLRLTPISWRWADNSGFETQERYAGFGAQNVIAAGIPHAARKNRDGLYGFDDRAMVATMWNAIKTMAYMLGATWVGIAAVLILKWL